LLGALAGPRIAHPVERHALADLVMTLSELGGLGHVALTEAVDLTTPIGRVTAGLLAVFAESSRGRPCARVSVRGSTSPT